MPNSRKRALLPAEERAHLEDQELAREGTWEPFLVFSDTKRDENGDTGESTVVDGFAANDEPPFAHAHSLMDSPHQGHLILEHTILWSGGMRLTLSDGANEVKFMLHARQLETLMEAFDYWNRGRQLDWLNRTQGDAQ